MWSHGGQRMDAQDIAKRRAAAADDFNRHERRSDGERVIASLGGGLTLLRDSLYARLHDDVQRRLGMDSMLSPLSEEKTERMTKLEIELFQMVVSAATVRQRGYANGADDWYLHWMGQFRLGPINSDGRVAKRLAFYLAQTQDDRRLAFSNVLSAALPQSRKAPLVLFRLVPSSVEIATALAFGKTADAGHCRRQQMEHLPAIGDCHECRGRVLDNGEQCRVCGNPVWKFEWLTAAD